VVVGRRRERSAAEEEEAAWAAAVWRGGMWRPALTASCLPSCLPPSHCYYLPLSLPASLRLAGKRGGISHIIEMAVLLLWP